MSAYMKGPGIQQPKYKLQKNYVDISWIYETKIIHEV